MIRSLFQTCTALLLSISTIAGGSAHSGIRHTHLGGEQPRHHHHHHDEPTAAGHGHHHHHSHLHHCSTGRVPSPLDASVHVHWVILGIDIALPDRGQKPSERRSGDTSDRQLLADCVIQAKHVFRTATLWSHMHIHGPSWQLPATELRSMHAARSIPPSPWWNARCDAARHERSGVELI